MQKNLDNGKQVAHPRPSMVDEYLKKALAERERFLERQPHLRAYQAEIDKLLDQSGNRQGRMAVLGTLMQGKLLDMQRELYKLTRILKETVNSQ
jgi:hypothetical protein